MTQSQRLITEYEPETPPVYASDYYPITAMMLGNGATFKDAERAASHLTEKGYFALAERSARKNIEIPFDVWSEMLEEVFNN